MIRKDLYYFILFAFILIPALAFTIWGGPFREVTIFDFLADDYFYAGTKNISGESVNIFSAPEDIAKVKSNILKFKTPYETFVGEKGMIYINYPEAVIALRSISSKLAAKQKLRLGDKTCLYVSSPEVGERLYNRGGRVYVNIHPHYRSHYRSRYGRYFHGRGSGWGK